MARSMIGRSTKPMSSTGRLSVRPSSPRNLPRGPEQAEKRWDARVGRAMDVAVPHELSTKAQWELVRGFGLQLRDTYGVAFVRESPSSKCQGRRSQRPRSPFHDNPCRGRRTATFQNRKFVSLDDRKLGPIEIERIREMWELRCNRALRKAGCVGRRDPPLAARLRASDRPATQTPWSRKPPP